MKTFATTLAAALFAAGTAFAADAPPAVPPAPPVPAPAPAAAFDWSGLYAGIHGGINRDGIPPGQAGIQVGYNVVPGNVLIGVEARLGGFFEPGGDYFDLEGMLQLRVGFLLGDRVLAYGALGAGHVFCCDYSYWTAAAGLEIGLGERWSIFGEARVYNDLPLDDAPLGRMFRVGMNFHL